jgi:hypothetical protein
LPPGGATAEPSSTQAGPGPAPIVFLLALLAAALLSRPALTARLREAARIPKPAHALSPLERPG